MERAAGPRRRDGRRAADGRRLRGVMHEFSIASAVVDTAVRHAGGRRVTVVSVRCGRCARSSPPRSPSPSACCRATRCATAPCSSRRSSRRGCTARTARGSGRSTCPCSAARRCGTGGGRRRVGRGARGGHHRGGRGRGGRMHRVKVRVVEDALDANNTIARANRDDFDRHGVTVLNVMSAPGAGKTTILERMPARGPRRPARRRARGRRAGLARRRPARAPARAGRAAQHRQRLRRRVPPRREHGALGAARDPARRDRPADRRERRQPRLPGGVPDRRGRADHGRLGGRGRRQAAASTR